MTEQQMQQQIQTAYRVARENFPIEQRMQAVFVPKGLHAAGIAILNACLDALADARLRQTKKHVRAARAAIEEYYRRWYDPLNSETRDCIDEASAQLYHGIIGQIKTFQFAYLDALRKLGIDPKDNITELLTALYLSRHLITIGNTLDKRLSAPIDQKMRENGLRYVLNDTHAPNQVRNAIDNILASIGMPPRLNGDQINQCEQAITNIALTLELGKENKQKLQSYEQPTD